jgi:hypothetical protein
MVFLGLRAGRLPRLLNCPPCAGAKVMLIMDVKKDSSHHLKNVRQKYFAGAHSEMAASKSWYYAKSGYSFRRSSSGDLPIIPFD